MGWNNQNVTSLLIINSSGGFTGLFVYNPSPGPGNLVAAIAGANGTDPYGNRYFRVISIINQTTNGISFLTADVNEVQNAYMGVSVQNPGVAEHLFCIWAGAAITNTHGAISDQVQITLFSSALDGSSKAAMIFYYVTPASVNVQAMKLNDQGMSIIGFSTAQAPGNTQPTAETWHDQTGSLMAGWTGGTAPSNPRVKLVTENKMAFLQGQATHAATAGITDMLTLPAAYRPTGQQIIPAVDNNGAPLGCLVRTSGIVSVTANATTLTAFSGQYALD